MPRIALGIEYDGRPFHGWQRQMREPSVQGAVETAIQSFLSSDQLTGVIAAGRTDAGVHAIGQVVHFDTEAIRDHQAWVRGLNALLPESIATRWACEVADDFHARFDAYRRTYVYRLYNHPIRSPLHAGRAAWCFRPLDVEAMRAAAAALLGEQDFSCFRSSQCQAKSPIKTVYSISIDQQRELINLTISANAFLHHMVRNIVGSLVYVGLGRQPVSWIADLIASRDRRLAAPTYSAEGLYFAQVLYPARFNIPVSTLDAEVSPSP